MAMIVSGWMKPLASLNFGIARISRISEFRFAEYGATRAGC